MGRGPDQHGVMSTPKTLKHVVFALVAFLDLAGGAFAAGYLLDEPGGWTALGFVALWLASVAALITYAGPRPGAGVVIRESGRPVGGPLVSVAALPGPSARRTGVR